MRLTIVCIRDTAADVYMPPQFVPHIGSFVRTVTDEVNKSDGSTLSAHAEDFIVFKFGYYDDVAGTFDILGAPEQLVRCVDLKRS